ncbi:hypothetical protein CALCODRAFT_277815 [Calocera cornea HHB12733]|uniref:Uncharacterized protein n=1 Tax=Calocera cornea HHB12733 TaxID=1353952 RepID=A0A165JPU0_9BASI|nr:hypothetical protein CALCODRAFT_277815 [Calocera cornea HHB12733]
MQTHEQPRGSRACTRRTRARRIIGTLSVKRRPVVPKLPCLHRSSLDSHAQRTGDGTAWPGGRSRGPLPPCPPCSCTRPGQRNTHPGNEDTCGGSRWMTCEILSSPSHARPLLPCNHSSPSSPLTTASPRPDFIANVIRSFIPSPSQAAHIWHHDLQNIKIPTISVKQISSLFRTLVTVT